MQIKLRDQIKGKLKKVNINQTVFTFAFTKRYSFCFVTQLIPRLDLLARLGGSF